MSENKILEELKEKILLDREIKKFIIDNKITKEIFEADFPRFVNQYENTRKCKTCPGLHNCQMDVYGYSSRLEFYNGRVSLVYFPCKHYANNRTDLLEMLYFPNSTYLLNKEVDFSNPERTEVLKQITRFMANYKKESFTKGILLHGPFGTGKTLLLLHLAHNLTKQNIRVLFAYYPDLVRHLKSTITTNTLEDHIDKLKNVEILILDDVGAENNSSFVRDEILGPILQYRMMANLPVFMTSNYSTDLLREHFKESRDEANLIKSDRIVERIRYMMEVVELKGKNYRF